jgi:hypothetical protein
MAKKPSGRSSGKAQKRVYQHVQPRGETTDVVPPVKPAPEAPVRQPIQLRRPGSTGGAYAPRRDRPAAAATMPVDYSYVLKDLRRVGVLVGIIVTMLVVLTIVLR